jgi:hypothetical protein
MPFLKTYPLANSAILRLNAEKENINVEPWYQRRGEVWTPEKKQLLIDSILNDYDIPKLYFHSLSSTQKSQEGNFDYAIIDGRQRLESIWSFADDGFPLSDDFVYLLDAKVNAAGMTYSQLSSAYPRLKIRFDSFTLPIVCVETDDIDLIEDMFSRLNEAVPLNAAEKRNAIGGPMAQCIRTLSEHHFFAERVKFADTRYQYREVSARLLFLEYCLLFQSRIIDTKKPYLDDMVKKYKAGTAKKLDDVRNITTRVLNHLDAVFEDKDPLLRAQAVIPVYYLTMRNAAESGKQALFTRERIEEFILSIANNREYAQQDIANANFDLLEYDRMTQQGTNDSASIRERVRILSTYLGIIEEGTTGATKE